mmetsp:Transcript_7838/g.32973  ORF Transcript_7838/g.32973 Transcript_7838/m.32973 type:complete len:402 (+) Transcript_7838:304-1509(+)
MVELRAQHCAGELLIALLEDDDYHVVAEVPLPLQLLEVRLRMRQEGGDVEHDLRAHVSSVVRVRAGAVLLHVQAAPELVPALQHHLVRQRVQELVQLRAAAVAEHLVLALALLEVEDAEFVGVAARLLVERDQLLGQRRVLALGQLQRAKERVPLLQRLQHVLGAARGDEAIPRVLALRADQQALACVLVRLDRDHHRAQRRVQAGVRHVLLGGKVLLEVLLVLDGVFNGEVGGGAGDAVVVAARLDEVAQVLALLGACNGCGHELGLRSTGGRGRTLSRVLGLGEGQVLPGEDAACRRHVGNDRVAGRLASAAASSAGACEDVAVLEVLEGGPRLEVLRELCLEEAAALHLSCLRAPFSAIAGEECDVAARLARRLSRREAVALAVRVARLHLEEFHERN